jgi:hypothetical protein
MDGKMERAAKIRRERLYKSLDDLQRLSERRTAARQNFLKSNDMAKVLYDPLPYLVPCRILSHVLFVCTFVVCLSCSILFVSCFVFCPVHHLVVSCLI